MCNVRKTEDEEEKKEEERWWTCDQWMVHVIMVIYSSTVSKTARALVFFLLSFSLSFVRWVMQMLFPLGFFFLSSSSSSSFLYVTQSRKRRKSLVPLYRGENYKAVKRNRVAIDFSSSYS
jgi:hypothetical protein